ncbi:MAG: nucleotide sugar dehydrogenase [Halobacteriota archaeon]
MELREKIETKSARIAVIGLGYVGLPTAVNFTEHGFDVIGVNRTASTVNQINQGESHLKDLNLEERVARTVARGKLRATTDSAQATRDSDVIIITVPTPVTPDKRPDLSYVTAAGRAIAEGLGPGKLVVLESTVYPGVVEEVLQPILEAPGLRAGADFGLAYCPERYNPGDAEHAISDVVRVAGAITPTWAEATALLYRSNAKDVMVVQDIKTAEAAKVIENIQRDLNIALMNELALIFERLHVDIMNVIEAASTKWNFNVYYPGAGVGGHCLPVDPYYLVQKAEELGYHPQVITAGRALNDSMPLHVLQLLVDALNDQERSVKNATIVVLGLSYKENIGDYRESPTKPLIEELARRGANVLIVDPFIDDAVLKSFAVPAATAYDAAHEADALVLMTPHRAFKELDMHALVKSMRTPILIDGRRIFDPTLMRSLGFTYKGVGADNR